MRPRTFRITTVGMAVALSVASTSLFAAAPVRYESAPRGNHVQVEGTSNIHDWSGTSDQIAGWIEIPGQLVEQQGEVRLEPALQTDGAGPRIRVRIPAASLEGNRSGLASNMHKALRVSDHPYITFTLKNVSGSTITASGAVVWSVVGELQIAGTTREVDLALTVTPLRDGGMRIEVQKDLLMTDFGIDPPRAMMGMARAADEVDVQVVWLVQRQTPQPTLPRDAGSSAHRQSMSEVLGAYERARAALAGGDVVEAQAALAALVEHAEALAALNDEVLSESVRDEWQSAVAALQGSASNMTRGRSLSATRAAFVVLSNAVTAAVNIVGHDHEAPLFAYQHADQPGVAAGLWVQAPGSSDNGVRSPYANSPVRKAPEVVSVHPGQRPAAPGTE